MKNRPKGSSYIENLRILTERIKSCLSTCAEDRCPHMRERLENHVVSHHTTLKPSLSTSSIVHPMKANPSLRKITPLLSGSFLPSTDVQTSTTGMNQEMNEDEIYKLNLTKEILDWSKHLPVYQNEKFESLKLDCLNQFIENVNKLKIEINEKTYDDKLISEITKFVDPLPTYSKDQVKEISKNELKEILFNKIKKLNHINNSSKNKFDDSILNFVQSTNMTGKSALSKQTVNNNLNAESYLKDVVTNTSQVYKFEDVSSTINKCLSTYNIYDETETTVDAETQHNIPAIPFYNKVFKPTTKPEEISNDEICEKLYKQEIYKWFEQIFDKYKIALSSKEQLVHALYDCLKQSLHNNIKSSTYKIALKADIFEFIDNLPLAGIKSNSIYVKNLTDDLTDRLLCIKMNEKGSQQNIYYTRLPQCTNGMIDLNVTLSNKNLKRTIHDIIVNNMKQVKQCASNVIDEIVNKIYDSLLSGTYHFNAEQKIELHRIIRNSTNICDDNILQIINSILVEIKYIASNIYASRNDEIRAYKPFVSRSFLIYKTEDKIRRPRSFSNISNISIRSSILKSISNDLNFKDNIYIEKIAIEIKSWIKYISNQLKELKRADIKDISIKNLAVDILDQLKMEWIAPETNIDRKKYMSFLILRWLTKIEYFEDISNVKPYIDTLIEQIESIDLQSLQTKPQSPLDLEQTFIQPENIVKEINAWLEEQPADTLLSTDQNKKDKIIKNFAQNLYKLLIKKRPCDEIATEIYRHLSQLINAPDKNYLNTLVEKYKIKVLELSKLPNIKPLCCDISGHSATVGLCEILQEMIKRYLEYYYYEENFLTREVYRHVFKTELQKLRTSKGKYIYDSSIRNIQQEDPFHNKLKQKLLYSKIVSDWLMTIPVNAVFNMPQNKTRAETVNNIIQIISEFFEDGKSDLVKKGFEKIFKQLPVHPNRKKDMTKAMEDLFHKIDSVRSCCKYPSQQFLSNDSIQGQNLAEFIDEYVRNQGEDLTKDNLKFIALTSLLANEVQNSLRIPPDVLNSTKVCIRMDDTSESYNEIIRRFGYLLGCVKEISDWLNNLPLKPVVDKSTLLKRVETIYELADEMSKRLMIADKAKSDSEISEFIKNWFQKLPLLPSRDIDIPIATKQLLNRIRRNNKKISQDNNGAYSNTMEINDLVCHIPQTCCNKSLNSEGNKQNPGETIVNTIEKWSNDLPIQAEDEHTANKMRYNAAKKMYQTINELNRNPEYFNNDILYQTVLSDEIDRQLQNFPSNELIQNEKDELKKQLIQTIIINKNIIRDKNSGEAYKLQLEKAVEIAMPNATKSQNQEIDGNFEIFKDRITSMFILKNFDYSDHETSSKYEIALKDDTTKYFENVRRNNNITTFDEDITYKNIYESLSQISKPQNNSMENEIEEIKTKCEISEWFKTLPLRRPKNDKELLDRDKIITVLSKRIHQIENSQENIDYKMHNEIVKWLLRLPLLSGQEKHINYFADDLQGKLQTTKEFRKKDVLLPYKCSKNEKGKTILEQSLDNREPYSSMIPMKPVCCAADFASQSKSPDFVISPPCKWRNENREGIFGESQLAGPSSERNIWNSLATTMTSTCCQKISPKKPAELILDIVDTWCRELPLPVNSHQEKELTNAIIDNLIIQIISKISELNMNPETFNDDFLYECLLDDALEFLLSTLPTNSELTEDKRLRKRQLINAIKAIKPLIKLENIRHEYKQEIKNTIGRVIYESCNNPEQTKKFMDLSDDIVDNFIEYKFYLDDPIKQKYHQKNICDGIATYYTNIDDINLLEADPVGKCYELFCELDKIPSPGIMPIIEDVQEVRLKTVITKLFSDIYPGSCTMSNQVKSALARRLLDIEKIGYTDENKNIVKQEIIRTLEKLGVNIDDEKVDEFVKKIESSKESRKLHFPEKNKEYGKVLDRHSQNIHSVPQSYDAQSSRYENTTQTPKSFSKYDEGQRLSLKSVTALSYNFNCQNENKENITNNKHQKLNYDQSERNYQSFKRDIPLSSTIIKKGSNVSQAFDNNQERLKIRTNFNHASSQVQQYFDPEFLNYSKESEMKKNQSVSPLPDTQLPSYRSYKDEPKISLPYKNETKADENQFISFLPASPLSHNSRYQNVRKENTETEIKGFSDYDRSGINYQSFERNLPLSSTVMRRDPNESSINLPNSNSRLEKSTYPPISFPRIDKNQWFSLPPTSFNSHSCSYQNRENFTFDREQHGEETNNFNTNQKQTSQFDNNTNNLINDFVSDQRKTQETSVDKHVKTNFPEKELHKYQLRQNISNVDQKEPQNTSQFNQSRSNLAENEHYLNNLRKDITKYDQRPILQRSEQTKYDEKKTESDVNRNELKDKMKESGPTQYKIGRNISRSDQREPQTTSRFCQSRSNLTENEHYLNHLVKDISKYDQKPTQQKIQQTKYETKSTESGLVGELTVKALAPTDLNRNEIRNGYKSVENQQETSINNSKGDISNSNMRHSQQLSQCQQSKWCATKFNDNQNKHWRPITNKNFQPNQFHPPTPPPDYMNNTQSENYVDQETYTEGLPSHLNMFQRKTSVNNRCRRPSITIITPVKSDCSSLVRDRQTKDTEIENDYKDGICEMRIKRLCKERSVSPYCIIRPKFCKICNGIPPFYCGIPRKRCPKSYLGNK